MPTPIICADPRLCQFARRFHACFSKPQAQYFVTVLLALLLCLETTTCSGLQRAVCLGRSLAGLSRFLAAAPWSVAAVAACWTSHFRSQLAPAIAAEIARRKAARPARAGRPPVTLLTGYLAGDDSVCVKLRAQQVIKDANPQRVPRPMAAIGRHYSSTVGKTVLGHDIVLTHYMLLGRGCPQQPDLYRQETECVAQKLPFKSKIELMAEQISRFVPPEGTRTHVLLDSWYGCKQLWKLARERGYLITTGLKSNRWLWVADQTAPRGGQWQRLNEYAADLCDADYREVVWPSQQGGHKVWVHVVRTRVRKLYTCQLVLVRENLTGPVSGVRYWASSDLAADAAGLVGHIAARWGIEVLIADLKELGLDQYQILSAAGIVRWWTLVLAAYVFLEEQRARLLVERSEYVTIGATRREIQARHRRNLLDWLFLRFQHGDTPDDLAPLLAA
jgi:DDE superfamily endonuclease